MKYPKSESRTGPRLLRTMSQRTLLEALFAGGPATRPELSKTTDLSQPTVIAALADLVESGLAVELGREGRALGRPVNVYSANAAAGSVTVIDVGRVWLRVAVVDLVGQELSRVDIRNHARTADELVELISDSVAIAQRNAAVTERPELTVLGTPGVLGPFSGALRFADQLPGWHGPQLLGLLRESLGKNLIVENDVNLAGLAEADAVAAPCGSPVAYLHVGTGVGLAVVAGGRLQRGAQGAAGELAYLPAYDPVQRRRVSLEDVLSARGLVNGAKKSGLGELSPKELLESAAHGEARAAAVLDVFCDHLAAAVITIMGVVDPERVVLGGGIGCHMDRYLEAIQQKVGEISPFEAHLQLSTLGDAAVLRGATQIGLQRAREELFDKLMSGNH